MSRAAYDLYLRRLRGMLSRADDEWFIQAVWAVDALQSMRSEHVRNLLIFPKEAAVPEMDSPFAIYKWELETLTTQLLTTPKLSPVQGRVNYRLQCDRFNTMVSLANVLRSLENAEAGTYIDDDNILNEMHRIAQRTFSWQRGMFNKPAIYRSSFIFGHHESAAHFHELHGIGIDRFMLAGYVLAAIFIGQPFVAAQHPGWDDALFLPTAQEWDTTSRIISLPVAKARPEAAELCRTSRASSNGRVPIAFLPSILRRYPILSFGERNERLRAPLFQLVVNRVSSGLYYDVVPGGPASLRNEVAARFEQYSLEVIKGFLTGVDATPSYPFQLNGKEAHTPDVLIRRDGELLVAIECKATKLTLGAQFDDDPFPRKSNRYDEMVKGVMQLWRFFSQARRGIASRDRISDEAKGIVLTLDPWMMMSDGLQASVLEEAGKQADRDDTIQSEDRRPVLFTNIADLEFLLSKVDEAGFYKCVDRSAKRDRLGWMITTIPDEIDVNLSEPKPYPFDVADRLPWIDRGSRKAQV